MTATTTLPSGRKAIRTRQRLLETALRRFEAQGYEATTLRQIADDADCSLGLAYRYFGRKTDLVVALYEHLAAEFESEIAELPAGTVAARFRVALHAKLNLVRPHRNTSGDLLAAMLNPNDAVSVLGHETSIIRARVLGVFAAVVHGADDAPSGDDAERLARQLYALHLLVLLLWMQDRSGDQSATTSAVDTVSDLLDLLLPTLSMGSDGLAAPLARVDRVLASFVPPVSASSERAVADDILERVFLRRRSLTTDGEGADAACETCFAIHRPLVARAMVTSEPVHFVLPAFPAKSPNRQAVLGALPDLGEELALTSLQSLCDEIRSVYSPGARVTVCSDGRVFADVVGITDNDVTEYGAALRAMIRDLGLTDIDTFSLEEVLGGRGLSHDDQRARLDARYADSIEVLRDRAARSVSQKELFNGMHRFVFDDLVGTRPGESRTQLRKEAKEVAWRVIQRSHAWSRVVGECFPEAVRLSIHPQPVHAAKIGIELTRAVDAWMTPWHGVVVLRDDGYVLMKRVEAERAGAVLSERDGRPDHYEMPGVRAGRAS